MPKMKNSGVNWLHKIPTNWQTSKLLYCLREQICDGPHETPNYIDNGIPFVSVDSLNDGKNINFDIVKKFISEQQYQAYMAKAKLEVGDILFSKAATIGKTAIVPNEKFMIWSPLAVIKNNQNVIDNIFLYYLLNCAELITAIRLSGSYNTQANVGIREIERAIIPVPSLEVQKSIANFLDQKCSEIDSLSIDIQSQIDVLEEYKKSIITEAVTKGLNPDVKMKDSGIGWIGMIPEHWDLKPLKYNFTITSGSTPNSTIQDFWDGDVLWITPADFKTDDYYTSGGRRNISKLGYQSCSTNMIPSNSIIFSKRAPIGSVVINSVPLCTNQGCLACIPNTKLNIKFYYFVMSIYDEIFNLFGNGTTFKEISATVFSNMHFAEPTLEEQQEIVDFLDKKCAEIDAIIASKKAQLETLAEYKKSLIYEYVTGKKGVPSNEF